MMSPVSIADFNKISHAFWDRELDLAKQRMSDGAVLATASGAIASEIRMGVPVRYQKSFYVALAEAEEAKRRFTMGRGDSVAAEPKPDAAHEQSAATSAGLR